MRSSLIAFAIALSTQLASCGDDAASSNAGAGGSGAATPQSKVTKMVGPDGGVIDVGGATVTFAKGSLSTMTEITIEATDEAPPDGFVALSKVFACGPSGTDFAVPVTMTMPFTDDGKGATMFWSSGADPSFKEVGGALEAGRMKAEVKHFSKGFVGRVR